MFSQSSLQDRYVPAKELSPTHTQSQNMQNRNVVNFSLSVSRRMIACTVNSQSERLFMERCEAIRDH